MVAWMHGQTGGEAVGSAVIRWQGPGLPEIRSAYPDVVEIAHVQVRPDVRGRGVGTCLMRTAEGLARLRGVPRLGLGVGVENPPAAALYERLGYTGPESSREASINISMSTALSSTPSSGTSTWSWICS